MAIPYREGVLLCADKRRHTEQSGYIDTTTKIVQLNQRAFFATTGTSGMLETVSLNGQAIGTRENEFARNILLDYFREVPVESMNWQVFREELNTRILSYFSQFRPLRLPETTNPAGEILFQSIIFYLDRNNSLKGALVKYLYRMSSGRFEGAVTVDLITEDYFNHANTLVLGDALVVMEIISGSDPRFEDLRTNRLTRRFRPNAPPTRNVPRNEVRAFASLLITATAERLQLLGLRPSVSSQHDCAVLTARGFQWLRQYRR